MNPHTKTVLALFVTVMLFLTALAFELIWSKGRRWLALITVSILLLIMVLTIHFASAHDHKRPGLDGWYSGLKSRHGGPCCDGPGVDATHLADNEWVDVPDDAVLEEPNRDGRTLVWPWYKDGKRAVRCFVPGSMT